MHIAIQHLSRKRLDFQLAAFVDDFMLNDAVHFTAYCYHSIGNELTYFLQILKLCNSDLLVIAADKWGERRNTSLLFIVAQYI